MTDHRTPNGRRHRRGWGGLCSSGPGPVSSCKSNVLVGNRSSGSIVNSMRKSPQPLMSEVGQTSSQTVKGTSNLRGSSNDSQASSGKYNVHNEDRTSRSYIVTYRNKSPKRPRLRQSSPEMVRGSSHVGGPESKFEEHLFDICRSASIGTVQLKKSFLELNRESKREREQFKVLQQPKYLRSGMVLLKNFVGLEDQVSSGKYNVHNEDRISRSYTVTYRNKAPQRPRLRQSSPEMVRGSSHVGGPESKFEENLFDICRSASIGTVQLKKSFLELYWERKREREQFKVLQHPKYLRSGMVLLKNYITFEDQETMIKNCRELGIGKGGFYQPGYRNGAKLHLKMMCLGKDWDPESRMYGDCRSIDGARPPEIPVEFKSIVEEAIKAAHDLIRENNRHTNVEYELPKMSPDICIVNFYNNNGKLGLHQDRDESRESIAKGVPIVSFSVGDSAEFLYGDKMDVDTAEKLVLESGDVLVFGGKSRSIFHGVSSILPKTAPKPLMEETKLRPGHLNLTFRQL